MEKNSDSKDSNSEGSVADNTENPDLGILVALENSLFLKQEGLVKNIEDLKKLMDINRRKIAYFENLISSNENIEHQSTNLDYLEFFISPIGSPSQKSQNSDSIEILPDLVLTPNLILPDANPHNNEKIFGPSEILSPETNQDSPKVSSNTLKILNPETLKTERESQIEKIQSIISHINDIDKKIRENRVDTESDTSFEIILHEDSMESNADSSGNSVGKGKEAVNPKYRYKKRSKGDVSSSESVVQETPEKVCDTPEMKPPRAKSPNNEPGKITPTLYRLLMKAKEQKGKSDSSFESSDKDIPVIHSEIEFDTPDSKTLKPPSPKEEFTRVSPSVKRKQSDSNEPDNDKIQSDESCAKTSLYPNSPGNHENDNLNIAKKLKFEDDEKSSEEYPYTQSVYMMIKHEELCLDLTELIGVSQTDQSGNESEQLIHPSASGLSNTVTFMFSSEESSPTNESEYASSNETGLLSPCYMSEDGSSSESRESASRDVPSNEI